MINSANLLCTFICLVVTLLQNVSAVPCVQTVTPSLSGSTLASTYYTAFDLDALLNILAGGQCEDNSVCPPGSAGSPLPFVHYIEPAGDFKWYKYYKNSWSLNQQGVASVAFFGATNVMAVLQKHSSNSFIILQLSRADGTIISAYREDSAATSLSGSFYPRGLYADTSTMLVTFIGTLDSTFSFMQMNYGLSGASTLPLSLKWYSSDNTDSSCSAGFSLTYWSGKGFYLGGRTKSGSDCHSALLTRIGTDGLMKWAQFSTHTTKPKFTSLDIMEYPSDAYLWACGTSKYPLNTSQQRMYIQRIRLDTNDPYMPKENKVVVQSSLPTSSEVVQCNYARGLTTDINKGYAIAFSDGGTVGNSDLYVIQIDIQLMTIKYYSDAKTKFLYDKNYIYDAIIPQSIDYAYFVGGIAGYVGISGGQTIYQRAGIVKVPLAFTGIADTTQGISYTVNYNQYSDTQGQEQTDLGFQFQTSYSGLIKSTTAINMQLLATSTYAGATAIANIAVSQVPQTQSITITPPTVVNQVLDKATQTSGSYQVPPFTLSGGCTAASTYAMTVTSSVTGANITPITFDSSILTVYWTNALVYAVYTIKITMTVTSGGMSSFAQFTLTVTSSTDCSQATITSTQPAFPLQIYTISYSAMLVSFNAMVTSMPSCTILYSIQNDGTGLTAPAIFTLLSITHQVQIGQTYDNSYATNSFILRVTGEISGQPTIKQTVLIPVRIISSCTILVANINGGFSSLSSPLTIDINDANPIATQIFTATVNVAQPALGFAIVDGGGTAVDSSVYSISQISTGNYQFKVETSSPSFAGTQQVYIKPVFSTCTLAFVVQATVYINNRCSIATVIAPPAYGTIYQLGASIFTIQLPLFTKTAPSCAYTVDVKMKRPTDGLPITLDSSVFTFDAVNMRLTMQTSDTNYLTIYNPVQIFVYSWATSNPAGQGLYFFEIQVQGPCPTATITMVPSTQTINTYVGAPVVTIPLTFTTNVISTINCGSWFYQIQSIVDSANSNTLSLMPFLGISGNILTIQVTDETLADLSPYTITISATQGIYITAIGTGTIIIKLGCNLKSIEPNPVDIEDQASFISPTLLYKIGQPLESFKFHDFIFTPSKCKEDITYSVALARGGAIPSFISINDKTISVQTSNKRLTGTLILVKVTPVLSATSSLVPQTINSLVIPIQLSYPNTGAPYFTKSISKINLNINETKQITIPVYQDPDLLDSVKISYQSVPSFVMIQYPSIIIAPTDSKTQVGTFTFKIILTDDNPSPLQNTYDVSITVKHEEKPYSETGVDSSGLNATVNENQVQKSASIQSISQTGDVVIAFNFDLLVPEDLSKIDLSSLLCILIPGDSDEANTILQWSMIDFKTRSISIKLNFTDPLRISNSYERDKLEVKFNPNSDLLVEASTQKQVHISNELIKDIPRQLDDDIATQLLQRNSATIKAGATAFVMSNMVLNVVLASSLQFLWGMINVMQLIVHMPLMNLVFPANAVLFYNFIIDVSNFDIIPSDSMQSKVFVFTDSPSSPWFDQLGYSQNTFLQNMGSMMVYVCIYLGIAFSVPIIGYFKGRNIMVIKLYNYLRENFFFNGLLRLFLEGYMQFTVCSLISTANYIWDNSSDRLSILLGIFFTIVIVILPFFAWYLLWRDIDNLKYKHAESTYGSLYNEIKTSSKYAVMYHVVYMVRRLVFVVIALTMYGYPYAQGMLVIFCSVLVIIYNILVKPFHIPKLNDLEIFNEICILIAAYHLLLYTDFDFSSPTDSIDLHLQIQYKCGWSMIAITTFNILVNMLFIMRESYYNLKLQIRKYLYLIRKYLRNRVKKYEVKQTFNDTITPLQIMNKRGLNIPSTQEGYHDFFQMQQSPINRETQQSEVKVNLAFAQTQHRFGELLQSRQSIAQQTKRKGSIEESDEGESVIKMRRRWKNSIVRAERIEEEMERGL